MTCCDNKSANNPISNYDPINCKPQRSVQEALFEQHWEEARSLKKQKMWITGLYFAAFSYIFNIPLPPEKRMLLLLLAFAGVAAFLAVFNLQYLTEIHMAKAQIYVAGKEPGVIFDFTHAISDYAKKDKESVKGEKRNCKQFFCCMFRYLTKCFCYPFRFLSRLFLCLTSLTSLYSWIIFNIAVYSFYKYLVSYDLLKSYSYCEKLTGWISILVVSYFLIRCLMGSAQDRAQNIAKNINKLSRGWHNVSGS
jgi:hypothetical protein